MRRRARLAALGTIVGGLGALLTLGVLIYIQIRVYQRINSMDVWAMVANLTCVVMAAFGLLVAIRQIIRDRRLTIRIPQAEGKLCPWCHAHLSGDDSGHARCEQCERMWDRDAVEKYWQQFALEPGAAKIWLADQKLARTAARWKKPINHFFSVLVTNPSYLLAWVGFVFFVAAIVIWQVTSMTFLKALTSFLPMMFLMGGFFLLGVGQMRRKGENPYCGTCGYAQAPVGDQQIRCPECGADWTLAGAFVYGEPIRTTRQRVLGIVFFAMGLALMFGPLDPNRLQARLLPTDVLIHEVCHNLIPSDQWRELSGRQLNHEQNLTLAKGLLDKRSRGRYLTAPERNWLIGQLNAGALPAELVERFYSESYVFALDGPKEAKRGETVRASITATYRSIFPPGSGLVTYAYISAYVVNAKALPATRQRQMRTAVSISQSSLRERFLIESSDEVMVQVRVWLAVTRDGGAMAGQPITWGHDGTPVLPDDAVWSGTVTLAHVIDVKP